MKDGVLAWVVSSKQLIKKSMGRKIVLILLKKALQNAWWESVCVKSNKKASGTTPEDNR